MKNTRRCPKCSAGEEDILRVPFVGSSARGVPMGWAGDAVIVRLVCALCGYTEEWVESQDALEKMRRRYPSLRTFREGQQNSRSPSASSPAVLPRLDRCPHCEAPLIDFGHGPRCPRCSP